MKRSALVTGAGGFIASHLVDALLTRGWEVTALVHYNARGSWGWLEGCRRQSPSNLKVVMGDIRDPFLVSEILNNSEIVFHLAALIAIPYSYQAPASYLQTNAVGTLNLAEAARKNHVKRFIHASTSEVYGSARYLPMDEKHPLQAQSPYAASKIAADKIIESFVCSYDFPGVILRPFNTYGPRQSARAVVASIIAQSLSGKEVAIGSLHPLRDFTFVSDTVNAFINAADANGVIGESINLGAGQAISIGDLAKMIFDILGVAPTILEDAQRVRPLASEVTQLVSDNSKAKTLLQWHPTVSLLDGLARTIQWMREHRDLYQPEVYTI